MLCWGKKIRSLCPSRQKKKKSSARRRMEAQEAQSSSEKHSYLARVCLSYWGYMYTKLCYLLNILISKVLY